MLQERREGLLGGQLRPCLQRGNCLAGQGLGASKPPHSHPWGLSLYPVTLGCLAVVGGRLGLLPHIPSDLLSTWGPVTSAPDDGADIHGLSPQSEGLGLLLPSCAH